MRVNRGRKYDIRNDDRKKENSWRERRKEGRHERMRNGGKEGRREGGTEAMKGDDGKRREGRKEIWNKKNMHE